MAVDRLDFDNLGESDLNELITAKVPEGIRIEYKRDLYGNSDADKREALKDVSGFANAFGGQLIIGIEEQNGLPIAIPGISIVNPDDEILRLEQLIRTGIEPRIQGLRVRAVPLAKGTYCFVLRISRSWYPPHRVSAQKSNRFWIRNSSSYHEASMEELRTLFTLGANALQLIHQFREDRVHEIISGNSARPLQGNGRLILHIIPLAAVTSSWQVDLEKVFQVNQVNKAFRPMGATAFWQGGSPRFNFEGLVIERGGEHNSGYTQIFRNGALEATKASTIRSAKIRQVDYNELHIMEKKFIHGPPLEKHIFEVLPGYLNGLCEVGVPPPVAVLFTLEGVKGIPYEVRQHIDDDIDDDPVPVIEREILYLPECLINEYGPDPDYHRAVKPAFDTLWNTAGRRSAHSFSADGIWRQPA